MANEKSGRGSQHVRDVMTPNPKCVTEKDSIRDVARIMKSQDTGVVPVVEGKRIIGLITDRDIVVRGLAEGKNLENAQVNVQVHGGIGFTWEHTAHRYVARAQVRARTVGTLRDSLDGLLEQPSPA